MTGLEMFYVVATLIAVFLFMALIGTIELIKEELELLNKYIVHQISRNTENIDNDLRDINNRLNEIQEIMKV